MGGGLALKRLTQKTTVVMNHKYKIILMGEYTFLLQWWDHTKSSKPIANWTLSDIILLPRWNVFILSHPKFLSSMHSDTNPVCWPKPYSSFFFLSTRSGCLVFLSQELKRINILQGSNSYKTQHNCSHRKDHLNILTKASKGCDCSDAQPVVFLSAM